jgi:hypothetical protein
VPDEVEIKLNEIIREIEADLPGELHGLLSKREGAALLVQQLPKVYSATSFHQDSPEQRVWERVGLFYLKQNRFSEALPIYAALYEQMLIFQEKTKSRCHKGMPLVWMSDCYPRLGHGLISRRYLMLTLVEDAIRENGSISPETTGTYFRSVWGGRLSHSELKRYAKQIAELVQSNPAESFYPEWVLQHLDNEWISQAPNFQEAGVFAANSRYIEYLMSQLGDGSGKSLELLADYLISCMPGCRTARRQRSGSTDYDVVCSVEGLELDFRSELGRYFVCECKDWSSKADFTTMAKFCRVLDSVKSRFGILFSQQGISGEGKRKFAELEQLKVFQDRGIVIVVVDQKDLERLAQGANFISILRGKYERVRLNLIEPEVQNQD